ncbi:MAG: DUF4097 family beta strand repeat-containing protein [Terracidiphilus sp.]|jgi:DUF4097 and DUF4098 domain-containing protein YvlB
MSTVPPSTPPGGPPPPPYPPYDPRTQWRIYREQQRAAWRAQRDAWKAQRYAMKSSYANAYGPRVPSMIGPIILIGIGIIALLMLTGHIKAVNFWSWYGHWWPLLLIVAGLGLLAEWAIDLRREKPVRRGGGFIGILILLAFLGVCAAGWNHARGSFHSMFGDQGDDFFNTFGLPEHNNDQPAQTAQIPANASIEIENPRGDVSITAGDASSIDVEAHQVAYADSDSDAKKIFDSEASHLTVSGAAVLLKSDNNSSGHVNLTVTVPKSARVTVNAGKGDVTAAGLGNGISVSASHGDVHLSSTKGSVQVHFSGGKHDFSAHQVDGDLSIDGDTNDITVSEIKGKVTQSGEILGDVHIENVSGAVNLHTTVTNLELAGLPGDLNLNSDDLRVTEAKGPVRVSSHSKDIDLSQIYGESYVEDRNGTVSIEPAGAYAVEAKNEKGDVEITLPPNASANVEGRTHNGDIVTDYGLTVSGDESKTVTGRIGSGATKIVLSTDNGDLRIKKGSAFPATPPPPHTPELNVPPYHRVPSLETSPSSKSTAGTPRLKAPKNPPAPPTPQ